MESSELPLAEQKRMAAERASTQSRMREAYKRIYNNPYRQSSYIDPALFRYEAARVYAKDFYKLTPRSMITPALLVATVVAYQLYLTSSHNDKQAAIASGQATYYERALLRAKLFD